MDIGIIGAGRVGVSIAYVLKNRGMKITSVSDIHDAPLVIAKRYLGDDVLYTKDNMDVIKSSHVVAITTQDRAITQVAEEIAEKGKDLEGKMFFHTSGAHPSSILYTIDKKGGLIGSLHPLQTFPDIESAIKVIPTTYIFIEGEGPALNILNELGGVLGRKVCTIKGKDKVLYHLSAVFVCNLLCALIYAGKKIMDKIEIDLGPFFPIIDATLSNIKEKGPVNSLTGPVVRGDIETINSHIREMGEMELHKKVYKVLSLFALEMAQKRNTLNDETFEEIKRLLEG
ncbi:MAG: DUF2520 domain-containing protein [Syntrophorhabdaceae bacterium]|nr:DUF2520 domain-containing protein [Syntrophorhabdaceae bacterium]